MTNEQLFVLVRTYYRRLETELERLRERLPGDLEREIQKHYVGNSIIPGWDHEGWVEQADGDFVVLAGMSTLLDDLARDMAVLQDGIERKAVADETG